jgi:hypothetical protein
MLSASAALSSRDMPDLFLVRKWQFARMSVGPPIMVESDSRPGSSGLLFDDAAFRLTQRDIDCSMNHRSMTNAGGAVHCRGPSGGTTGTVQSRSAKGSSKNCDRPEGWKITCGGGVTKTHPDADRLTPCNIAHHSLLRPCYLPDLGQGKDPPNVLNLTKSHNNLSHLRRG